MRAFAQVHKKATAAHRHDCASAAAQRCGLIGLLAVSIALRTGMLCPYLYAFNRNCRTLEAVVRPVRAFGLTQVRRVCPL